MASARRGEIVVDGEACAYPAPGGRETQRVPRSVPTEAPCRSCRCLRTVAPRARANVNGNRSRRHDNESKPVCARRLQPAVPLSTG